MNKTQKSKAAALEAKREELTHKTFVMMFQVLVIFGLPAIGAYFGGNWLDTTYDMRPYGSLIAIAIALTISWVIIFRAYIKITNEFKALRKEEMALCDIDTEETEQE